MTLARILRVWLACLAMFAAATPASSSRSPERPGITAVVGTEHRVVAGVAPQPAPWLTIPEPVTGLPSAQRVPGSPRLFLRHRALLC
jgi:hypothetical protein